MRSLVWVTDMHDRADRLPGAWIAVEDSDREAFDARVRESSALAFRVAYGVLRHRQHAEDVAQEAMVRAFRAFHQLRDRAKFRAWLVRMAWRLALDEQRAHRRRLVRDGQAVGSHLRDAGPDVAAEVQTLWAAIDRLPDRLRQPLVLASIEGHTMVEVAALLELPEGTVKSRLFEARRLLKEWLQ
jgi:RNA polymerase sigma-70 factor, ECF subfamily